MRRRDVILKVETGEAGTLHDAEIGVWVPDYQSLHAVRARAILRLAEEFQGTGVTIVDLRTAQNWK